MAHPRVISVADAKLLDILSQGVRAWNEWRLNESPSKMDLSKANLAGRSLIQANFSGATLSGADLSRADLRGAKFEGANLVAARLQNALLYQAWMRGTNLNGASLEQAILSEAHLSRANLRLAFLNGAHLNGANLADADLSEADLRYASVVGADFRGAMLSRCKIYGLSAWAVKVDEGTVQEDLCITGIGEPKITVDNLEVAQFLYLLVRNEKVRSVIDTITSKVVLILGRFITERKVVLDALRQELRFRDYIPVLFDFDKPYTRDTHETVTLLARMARFIFADITDPKSIPQELVSIVEQLPSVPVQPILLEGSEPWGMYDHIRRYPWVLAVAHYRSLDELKLRLRESLIPEVEARLARGHVPG